MKLRSIEEEWQRYAEQIKKANPNFSEENLANVRTIWMAGAMVVLTQIVKMGQHSSIESIEHLGELFKEARDICEKELGGRIKELWETN